MARLGSSPKPLLCALLRATRFSYATRPLSCSQRVPVLRLKKANYSLLTLDAFCAFPPPLSRSQWGKANVSEQVAGDSSKAAASSLTAVLSARCWVAARVPPTSLCLMLSQAQVSPFFCREMGYLSQAVHTEVEGQLRPRSSPQVHINCL